MNKIEEICSLDELRNLTKKVLEFSKECRIILLRGDLASGKTTFVQEFAKELGIKGDVISPTFSVQNEYEKKLYHYDIYQNGINGFISQGLFEELDKVGFHLIEWGDEDMAKILDSYFIDYVVIEIGKIDKDTRKYKVTKCIH